MEDFEKIFTLEVLVSSDNLPIESEIESVKNNITEDITDVESDGENKENLVGLKRKKKLSFKEIQKRKKSKGLPYLTASGKCKEARNILPNSCKQTTCRNNCMSITLEDRQFFFNKFWELEDAKLQKQFLNNYIESHAVNRRRIKLLEDRPYRRRRTFKYFIELRNNEKLQVCQQFLLNTLNISQRFLRSAIHNRNFDRFPDVDLRGKHEPKHKFTVKDKKFLKKFIERLPAIPSHYCRSSSNVKYLPDFYISYKNVYRVYERECANNNMNAASYSTFYRVFNGDYNISIHQPRKDKCLACETFKNKQNRTEDDEKQYQDHLREKDSAKLTFLDEQNKCKFDHSIIVASFDLQKVLNTPFGLNNMLLYYSRRYNVYNFTVYESGSCKGFCYLWGETEGNRGSNEISTNLYKYLKETDLNCSSATEVSLYCDNCPGQNKNRILFCMINFFLKNVCKNIKKIKITFLVAGHTYMPVDSMHAVIENKVRKSVVWAPSEWPTIITNSRIKPEPYIVKKQNYDSFYNWKSMFEGATLQNIDLKKDIKINEIKKIVFEKGMDSFKYYKSYDDREEFYGKLKIKSYPLCLIPSYSEKLKLNSKKFLDLKNLCDKNIIPENYHKEYSKMIPSNSIERTLSDDCTCDSN